MPRLYMLLLGCKPKNRFTEQHDIFFGIAEGLAELLPAIKTSWPEAKDKIHIDAWREVNCVNGHSVTVVRKEALQNTKHAHQDKKLFFVNLGGYKAGEFDEFHYKTLVIAADLKNAQRLAMATTFFKHTTLPPTANHIKATAHIDDRYGIDVDDIFSVADVLSKQDKRNYAIEILPAAGLAEDVLHLGYTKFSDLIKT